MEKVIDQFVKAILKDVFNNHGELSLEPLKIKSHFSEYSYEFSVKNEFYIRFTFLLSKYSDTHVFGIIVRNDKKEDDSLLSDWLKYNGYKFDKDPFLFTTYHVDNLDTQIQGVIHFLRQTFENEILKGILQGQSWEDTPFDWGGLK